MMDPRAVDEALSFAETSPSRTLVEAVLAAEVRRLREIEQRARDVYDGRAEWTPGNGAQAEFASDIARHILKGAP